ncbi:amino acid-binding protein [Halobacteria archaeon AArc-dxtr1]|nr:amino acid-binding protein [Halobacteria archaeon AArc-dxtr1]
MAEEPLPSATVGTDAVATDGGERENDTGHDEADDEHEGDEPETDGGVRAYTVRLELVDEPGELLRALHPIADNGGNLLSIHHERGNITPRGHIPVEVDVECPPDRFDGIVEALRDAGVNVIQAGEERYGDELSVVLSGQLVDTDLSDTLSAIEDEAGAVVLDLSLAAPEGTNGVASARIRLAIGSGRTEAVLSAIRELGERKGLTVVEPLPGGEA